VQADRAEETVGHERRLAQNLRETPVAEPALELHLQESILRVDVAETEVCVPFAPRADVRHAIAVAPDFDPTMCSGDMNRARGLWL